MIDIFTLALTHSLLAVAAWRLLSRDDLDPPLKRGRAYRARQAQAPDQDGQGGGGDA